MRHVDHTQRWTSNGKVGKMAALVSCQWLKEQLDNGNPDIRVIDGKIASWTVSYNKSDNASKKYWYTIYSY